MDDSDLAEIDIDAWRASTAGAFQDHAKLELLAQETVGVGHLPRIQDRPAVHAALRTAPQSKTYSTPSPRASTPSSAAPGPPASTCQAGNGSASRSRAA